MHSQIACEAPVSPFLCSRCRRERPDAVPTDPAQIEICRCCGEPCQSNGCVVETAGGIEYVTYEQEMAVTELLDGWLADCLSTEPADRSAAERGARLAYEAVGLPPPHTFLWTDSPLQGALLARRLGTALSSERERVEEPLAQGQERMEAYVETEALHQFNGFTWEVQRVQEETLDLVRIAVDDDPRLPRLFGREGEHDRSLLATLDCCRFLGIKDLEMLEGLMLVARSTDQWWPFSGIVVLSDRPERFYRDEWRRLHAADGPAVGYRDGWGVWAWHGVPVPQQVIEAPETLVAKEIRKEQNVELRRIMIERYGAERYLQDIGAKLVDEDERGRLWRATLSGDESLVMVEVVNSTPEPDGSFKDYWLRVPPDCKTAREAVAWSFDQSEADYKPAIET